MRILLTAASLAVLVAAQPARQTDEFKTAAGPVRVTPIQHASVLVEVPGQVVYIDPAQGSYEGLPKADLIIYTDTHADHLNAKILETLRKPTTQFVAPEAAGSVVPGAIILKNGETKVLGKWTIEAVPMYNIKRKRPDGGAFHEKGRGNGYVMAFGGKRFLFAGDTEDTPELRAIENIDVAFIPMNLPYTMPPDEAAAAVRAFKPKIVYPYHYRGSDLSVFETALAGSGVEVRLRNWY